MSKQSVMPHPSAAKVEIKLPDDTGNLRHIVCVNARRGAHAQALVHTECDHCGRAIMHGPEVDPDISKICFGCAIEAVSERLKAPS
jgi:hypothetical protein